ncbi:sphingoid long-chain base transporter RSB1 [Podospora fimiseda]|uniref:Sphingoid long-chain base transporter RSB1 n=1 Tax=Podospora fimiseda TaxID=252190 RepID=A0AAN7BJA1_9PEZI|nr:sphingoid long-chain base transporter RSB1 [Podospora fimiseda]
MAATGAPAPPYPGFYPTYETCNEVSAYCPVKATTLGYFPNEGVNIFLTIGYGLAALITLVTGVWKRTWGFSIAVFAGCALECVGYVGRVLLAENPWNGDAFKIQIVAIVLGPTLLCIGLYLTLKHTVLALNPSLSRVSPKLYPAFFVPADISCLVIQAIGGGVAASAGRENYGLLKHGNKIIMAGIVLQVVVLLVFGLTSADYLIRAKKYFNSGNVSAEHEAGAKLWKEKKFRAFEYAMGGAYAVLLIRCIYRIAEMAGGWANHIMQDEPSFVVLESFMVLIASVLLAVFAPGIFFPQMSHKADTKTPAATSGSSEDVEKQQTSDSDGVAGVARAEQAPTGWKARFAKSMAHTGMEHRTTELTGL